MPAKSKSKGRTNPTGETIKSICRGPFQRRKPREKTGETVLKKMFAARPPPSADPFAASSAPHSCKNRLHELPPRPPTNWATALDPTARPGRIRLRSGKSSAPDWRVGVVQIASFGEIVTTDFGASAPPRCFFPLPLEPASAAHRARSLGIIVRERSLGHGFLAFAVLDVRLNGRNALKKSSRPRRRRLVRLSRLRGRLRTAVEVQTARETVDAHRRLARKMRAVLRATEGPDCRTSLPGYATMLCQCRASTPGKRPRCRAFVVAIVTASPRPPSRRACAAKMQSPSRAKGSAVGIPAFRTKAQSSAARRIAGVVIGS